MEAVIEKECSALGGLFQTVIADMKSSCPIWEDFITKAGKLQSQLRATAVAVTVFLDAFQKVADLATNSRGGTRDIGSALTRMCMRHRSIEAKLRQFSVCFLEGLINPLQEQMEEWKRGVNTLDKDHAKEYKRARQEIKKKSSDTLKLQKKAKKADNHGRGDFQPQLNSAMQDVNDKYILLEETEKQALRKALIEERQRFCCFVSLLQPVVDEEISMLAEVTHLQTISEDLKALTSDPHKLPPASEQVISDLKGSDYGWSYQTPPSSPSTTMSRKSSMCSSTLPLQAPVRLSSISSHDSGFISSSQDQNASSKSSSPMPAETKPCPSSSSSETSETGQLHGDCSTACSLTATALQHATDKLSNGFDHYSPASPSYLHSNGGSLSSAPGTSFPFFPPSSPSTSCPTRSWSRPASALLPDYPNYGTLGSPMVPSSKVPSWKDWAKPGPYDQPMVNTLRRRKDKEALGGMENNGSTNGGNSPPSDQTSISAPYPSQTQTPSQQEEKNRIMKADDLEAQNELALVLSRGLELDTQRSNRDSIQCSSGYSTQTNTPCCSEDTIPSQSISDYDYFSMAGDQEPEQQQPQQPSDFDKSSTIPRNSDIGQSYRRMFQTKRPASTAGMPITQTPYPGQGTYHGAAYPSTPVHTGAYPSAPAGQYTATSTGHGPVIITPGVATIRRTPSSKPCARRSGSVGGGPIPIRTPVVPVKIPTVPDMSGTVNGSRSPEEMGGGEESSYSSTFVKPGEAGTLPLTSWSGQASTNPPTIPLPNQLVQPYQAGGEEVDEQDEGNMLVAIRKGVKLKRTLTNDRSAPRIA
ncbi:metastasis suppressor protein 1-like isoform X9 [Poecilia reticulata]|uniref:metastasis suppressor protein 1-like isoform X9 n=1 Tax=Poecilia reticulata TaxID=8081 RepID=UPI0004A475E2|nr:PREDICTED: metastasis suppressor protein 1-like isoform X9 [Poecilia reticulata]